MATWSWRIFYLRLLQETRPSAIVLNSTDFPVMELLKYDIVICSHQLLRNRYTESAIQDAGFDLAYDIGVREAKRCFASFNLNRIRKPLHSGLYNVLNSNISILILDESHIAKNFNTMLNIVIRSLRYHHILMLTGTAIPNHFPDPFGQMALMPCSPLQDM